jgi:uroporphyrin-III C-methyltransferase/precorrin-2 dehydrogenase/sirohydrochlorin ferrochelatase
VLARLLRARLESLIPASYGQLASLAQRFRERVRRVLPAPSRRPFWERMLQGPIAELVFSGRIKQAEEALERALEDSAQRGPQPGRSICRRWTRRS